MGKRLWVVLLVLILCGCGTPGGTGAPAKVVSPPAIPTIPSIPTIPAVPAGTRAVTFHGLTFDVPVGWGLAEATCGTPIADTVMLPGVQASCAYAHPPRVSSLTFDRASNRAGGAKTDIDGHPAYRYTGRTSGLHTIEIVVPDLDAVATIASPSLATAHRIAGTASVTPHDVNGCANRRHDTAVLPTGKSSGVLIPGHPNAVVVCRYVDGWPEQSAQIKAVTRFVATFDHLPAGLSRANPGAATPAACAEPTDAYVVQVQYPDGRPLTVWARIGGCGKLGASNGTATGQRSKPLVSALVDAAGASQGWPGAVRPAH
jgi:hypothetical protein